MIIKQRKYRWIIILSKHSRVCILNNIGWSVNYTRYIILHFKQMASTLAIHDCTKFANLR